MLPGKAGPGAMLQSLPVPGRWYPVATGTTHPRQRFIMARPGQRGSRSGTGRRRKNPRATRQREARSIAFVMREDAGQRGKRQIKSSAKQGARHNPRPQTSATIGRADYGDLVPHKHGGIVDAKRAVWPKAAMADEMQR